MARTLALVTMLGLSLPVVAADAYTIKVAPAPVPKDVPADFAKLLGPDCVQLADAAGPICNLWLCKEAPSVATVQQAQNGLTYRELQETAFLGILDIVTGNGMTDYRKQKINPGIYTLRLGFQPQDGDHMGTAPYGEFCLAVPIKEDKKPAALENLKALIELSTKATGSGHPGVFLLFPAKPTTPPKLVQQKAFEDHWSIDWKVGVSVDKKAFEVGISLILIGKSAA